MPSLVFVISLVAAAATIVHLSSAQATLRSTPCGRTAACHPWDVGIGPFCGRGNKINLRFTMDLAPENHYPLYNTTPATIMQTAAYAFCPVVDELQAFNLSAGPMLGVLNVVGLNVSNITTVNSPDPSQLNFSTQFTEGYLSVYGFGSVDNVIEPNVSTSTGAVKIFSNDSVLCPGGILVSHFLVLAISLDKGRFKYRSDKANPVGSQFQSTCVGGGCTLDSKQKCHGTPLVSNCAKCYTNPAQLINATVQIWVSYYGTDVNGRTLLSGSNNPLNFQKFSSSGVWNNLQASIDNLENGQIINGDQLGPQGSELGG